MPPAVAVGPLCRRAGGHIEVKNAPTIVRQYQKHVKDLEAEGGDSEEIDGNQLLSVILQECAPGLRRWLATAHHVFAHAALPDVDAEFEQLTVDAGGTPTGILPAHSAHQSSDFAGNSRSSLLAPPNLPAPEETEALAMPSKDCVRLNNRQRRAPVAPDPGQPDPEKTVHVRQPGAFSRATLQHADLVAQSQVLHLEGSPRTEARGHSGEECRERNEHRRREL